MLTDFRAYLVGYAPLSALVGGRVYPVLMPQNPTLPAITYAVVGAVRQPTNDGADTMPRTRVQVDIYAGSFEEAQAVAALVKARLDAFRGTQGQTNFGGVFADIEQTLYESETKLHRVSIDFFVWHGAAA